jgi:ABC-type transport system substrate-binding protein
VIRSPVGARYLVLLFTALLAAGCGTASTPAPSPPASVGPGGTTPAATAAQGLVTTARAPTPTPAATPSPAYADTLRIGVDLGIARRWQPAIELNRVPVLTFGRLVYSGLYRYDGRDDVIPDLADGPCFVPGADGTVIRCRLVETTFHDGTPLTADDVAYTYQVFARPVLTYGLPTEVRVVDDRTVDFVLSAVDPTFITTLPLIPNFSRRSIDEAVAAFDDGTKGLTPAGLAKLAADIDAEISADPPVCSEARVGQVDAIFRRLGSLNAYHEGFVQPNGTFDACSWLRDFLDNFVDPSVESGGLSIGYALSQTGIDRVAGIVGVMSMARPDIFVGTGPYRYVSQDADGVHFEAFPGYHGGVAATRYVDFVRSKGDGSDLVAGAVDIAPDTSYGPDTYLGTAFEATAASHGVRVIHPPAPAFYVLYFNVRKGRLFSDVNLRKALQLCIDLPRDVDAVTGGAGIPVYSPVMAGTWGDDPTLPQPARDVAAARRLIEASGWQLGSDGVYAKGAVRLAAEVPVRGDVAERVKMVDLIAAQARDCGMDLRTLPLDGMGGLFTYPHYLPGTKTPFDAELFRWEQSGADPGNGPLGYYTSSQVSDAEHPDAANMGGFSDPAFDRLIAAANGTYDQADRARLLRQAQEELAAQVPTIFLWAQTRYDSLRSAVATVDGPIDLAVPNWAWQPERMVVAASAP